MTVEEKAKKLYRDAFMRWCYELSHDKNVAMAKDICIYICNEVLGYMGADRGHEFWTNVKAYIETSNHQELFIRKEGAIIKFNGGAGALLCSKCRKILKVGYEFNEEEKKFARGEIDHLDPLYCENNCNNER
jgi:hypothetical protein